MPFSAYAFGYVDDLNRVFRQVHRVLKRGAPLVFSLPHPAYDVIDDEMRAQFNAAIERVGNDDAVRAVVLTGKGAR